MELPLIGRMIPLLSLLHITLATPNSFFQSYRQIYARGVNILTCGCAVLEHFTLYVIDLLIIIVFMISNFAEIFMNILFLTPITF